jgi:hypothetical protein
MLNPETQTKSETQTKVETKPVSEENSHSNVLYYSIGFPGKYENILKIVDSTVLGNTADATKGLFVKTNEADFKPCFAGSFSDANKASLLSAHQKNISQLKEKEVFIVCNGVFYKVNDAFHITTLYTGGKAHDKCAEMESQVGKELPVSFKRVAISNSFITLGVGDLPCSYYGNEIKHVTFGLSKSGKKVFPKDSPTAFSNGTVADIDFTVQAMTGKFVKQ